MDRQSLCLTVHSSLGLAEQVAMPASLNCYWLYWDSNPGDGIWTGRASTMSRTRNHVTRPRGVPHHAPRVFLTIDVGGSRQHFPGHVWGRKLGLRPFRLREHGVARTVHARGVLLGEHGRRYPIHGKRRVV